MRNLSSTFKKIQKPNSLIQTYILFNICLLFFSFTLCFNIHKHHEQQFVQLADSFLQGKLYLIEPSQHWPNPEEPLDLIPWQDHYYWAEGPFPAIVLMPFVYFSRLIKLSFYQGYLQIFLVLFIFLLYFKQNRKIGYDNIDSLFMAYAFCFASMFLGIAMISSSYYFAQAITVLLLLLIINEYLSKKRYWLIGILFGFIALTRITACVGVILFALEILFTTNSKNKIKNLCQLFLPITIISSSLLLYNKMRFGNIFEQGYGLQPEIPSLMKARSYGLFSLVHVPGNLYYAFLASPTPVFKDGLSHVLKFPYITADPWGMSVFITSPYLIYLFCLKYKDKISFLLLATILAVATPIFLYNGIGYSQLGYRYALDFMPFLFLLLAKNYFSQKQKLSMGFKIIIVFSSFLNLYLLLGLIYNH
jgi:hypothetical protein